MHPKLPEILANKGVPIDNELLASYLKGELDETASHEIEKLLSGGDVLEQEALEGWLQSENPLEIVHAADEINKSISRQLQTHVQQKRKRPITQFPLSWWVFGLILVIICIAWVIINLLG